MPPAAFSHRSEAQRTEAYASPHRSLRPCWTAFLSILSYCGIRSIQRDFSRVLCINRVFPQAANPCMVGGVYAPIFCLRVEKPRALEHAVL